MAIKTVKVTVAPRRTVVADGKSYGPGADLVLPVEEAVHLRAQGFLINPAAAAAPAVGAGPSFGPPSEFYDAGGVGEE